MVFSEVNCVNQEYVRHHNINLVMYLSIAPFLVCKSSVLAQSYLQTTIF